jgi:hypothetical protein
MVKVVNETLRHCPHCGDRLTERNWCRHCGDITWLDEYQDDQLDKVGDEHKPDQKIRLPVQGTR